MADLLSMIKKAGIDAVGSGNPVNIMYGEVVSQSPLEIRVDQRFTLSADFLVIPESLVKYEVDLKHSHSYSEGQTSQQLDKIIIRKGLEAGDRVILVRVQGGQKYVVLDKVVTEI